MANGATLPLLPPPSALLPAVGDSAAPAALMDPLLLVYLRCDRSADVGLSLRTLELVTDPRRVFRTSGERWRLLKPLPFVTMLSLPGDDTCSTFHRQQKQQ
jgi:hypothetical protein